MAGDEGGCFVQVINTPLYADYLVLLGHDTEEVASMLRLLDAKCVELGTSINANKTELMHKGSVEAQWMSFGHGSAKYVRCLSSLES